MSALPRAALHYARNGWRVFPCREHEKLPAIKDWPNQATTEPNKVQYWWRKWPTANIGLACGPATGVYVIDVDQHDTDGEQGLAKAQKRLGPLPPTVESRTGSGGRQLFFRYPTAELRNKAGIEPGLDTRGAGGFVILPPSVHPCGQVYIWTNRPDHCELAELPAKWIRSLEKHPEPVRVPVPMPEFKRLTADDRIRRQLEGSVNFVAGQQPGQRNASLFWAACRANEHAAAGLISLSDAEEALFAAGLNVGLDQREIAATIRSARIRRR